MAIHVAFHSAELRVVLHESLCLGLTVGRVGLYNATTGLAQADHSPDGQRPGYQHRNGIIHRWIAPIPPTIHGWQREQRKFFNPVGLELQR